MTNYDDMCIFIPINILRRNIDPNLTKRYSLLNDELRRYVYFYYYKHIETQFWSKLNKKLLAHGITNNTSIKTFQCWGLNVLSEWPKSRVVMLCGARLSVFSWNLFKYGSYNKIIFLIYVRNYMLWPLCSLNFGSIISHLEAKVNSVIFGIKTRFGLFAW